LAVGGIEVSDGDREVPGWERLHGETEEHDHGISVSEPVGDLLPVSGPVLGLEPEFFCRGDHVHGEKSARLGLEIAGRNLVLRDLDAIIVRDHGQRSRSAVKLLLGYERDLEVVTGSWI